MSKRKKLVSRTGIVLCFLISMMLFGTMSISAAVAGTPVQLGSEVKCVCTNDSNKVQYFTFTTDSNYYYSLLLRNSGSGSVDYYVYEGTGESDKVFSSTWFNTGVKNYHLRLTPNKQYTVKISCYKGADCSFTVRSIADDYSNAFTSARPIAMNTSVEGNLEVAGLKECDMFSFQTDGNNAYYFVSLATTVEGSSNYIALYEGTDESYKVDDFSVGAGSNKYMCFKLKKNTTYYLKVMNYWDEVSSYRVGITQRIDNAGDSFTDATTITPGKLVNGTFEINRDVDFFKVTTNKKNTAYQIYLRNKSNSSMYFTVYYRDDIASKVKNADNIYVGGATTKCYLLSLQKGKNYYIKVNSGDDDAAYTVGLNVCNKSIKKAKVQGVKVTASSWIYSYKPYIYWTKNNQYSGVEIFRSSSKNGGYKKVKSFKNDVGYYRDNSAKRRHTYYYKMRYYVKDGKKTYYGNFTKPKKVKVK